MLFVRFTEIIIDIKNLNLFYLTAIAYKFTFASYRLNLILLAFFVNLLIKYCIVKNLIKKGRVKILIDC